MPDLTIDPTDPDLDLTQYSPEALVTARVQSTRPGEIGFVIPPDLREKVEADILARLNEEQKKRRAINLSIRHRRTTEAAKELLRRIRATNTNHPLNSQSDRMEDWYSPHAPTGSETPIATDTAGDIVSASSRESTAPDGQQVFEQVVDLLQQQIVNAEADTRIATKIAGTSAILAGLSLIVAAITLFRPVAIDQPDGKPVPVKIIQHTNENSPPPTENHRTTDTSRD